MFTAITERRAVIAPVILLPVLFLSLINHFVTIGVLFEGTLTAHKTWYPHFFYLSYAFVKLFFPAVYGIALYFLLQKNKLSLAALTMLIAQTIIVSAAMERYGFTTVAGYGYILMLSAVLQLLSSDTKQRYLNKIRLNLARLNLYYLFIGYLVISLSIGVEFHPFSRFPMYSSFPNSAYVFFLKNENDSIVPFHKYFSPAKNTGYVAHIFYSYFKYHGYSNVNDYDNPVYLRSAGKEIVRMIVNGENLSKSGFDSLKLYRRNYYLQNDVIQYRDKMMYEQGVKP